MLPVIRSPGSDKMCMCSACHPAVLFVYYKRNFPVFKTDNNTKTPKHLLEKESIISLKDVSVFMVAGFI